MSEKPTWNPQGHEAEHEGPWWTHPYMIYVWLTIVIFGGLCLAGYLAIKNGWIPNRGITPQ